MYKKIILSGMVIALGVFVLPVFSDSKPNLPTQKIIPKVKVNDLTLEDSSPKFDLKPFVANFRLLSSDDVQDGPKIQDLRGSLSASKGSEFLVDDIEDKLDDIDVDPKTLEFAIYRVNVEEYKTFKGRSSIGYGALQVGTARIKYFDENTGVSTLEVTQATAEVLVGDLLLPRETGIEFVYQETIQLDEKIEGHIIDTIQTIQYGATYQFVFLDIGKEAGLREGVALTVRSNQGYHSNFVKIPQKRNRKYEKIDPIDSIGTILLFKVYDLGSYGLITKAKSGFRKFDLVSTK